MMRATFTAAALLATVVAAPRLPAQSVNHETFDRVLRAHVVDGYVDYDGVRADPAFPTYLQWLARTNPATLSRADQLAFWINAYNAYTIQLIISKDERESIRNINKSLGLLRLKGPLVGADGDRERARDDTGRHRAAHDPAAVP